MSKQGNLFNDPATHRAMLEPHTDKGSLDTSLQAFWEDVAAARKKHRIAQVYIVIEGLALDDDGAEGRYIINGHFGSSESSETLAAYGYGHEVALRQERMANLLSKTIKRGPKP